MLWVCFSGEMFRTNISVNILIKAFIEWLEDLACCECMEQEAFMYHQWE